MQPLFLQGPSVTLRTIMLVIASIVLMMADHRWGHLETVRGVIESYIIYPLRYTINLPSTLVDWTDESFSSHQLLLEDNKKLREQQLRAQVSLQKLSVLEKENDRLRKMLSAQPKVGERVLVAEILSLDIDPYKQLVILNKGRSSDVYIGQPIIDAWGVMGQVVHLAENSSSALLISDPSHAIPVQVNRSGLRSTAFGTGRSLLLELRYMPHNVDLDIGDEINTSGLGGRFPPNYPVGRVVSIDRPAGESFATVMAEPVAHLGRSREVLLVWHNPPLKEEPTEEKQVEESAKKQGEEQGTEAAEAGKSKKPNDGKTESKKTATGSAQVKATGGAANAAS